MKDEEYKAVFMGLRTISFAKVRQEGGEVWMKTGMFSKYKRVLNHFVGQLSTYQEKRMFHPFKGDMDELVRVFFFDLDNLDQFTAVLPEHDMLKMQTLQQEVSNAQTKMSALIDKVRTVEDEDLFQKQMKTRMNFHKSLAPSQGSNGDSGKSKKK